MNKKHFTEMAKKSTPAPKKKEFNLDEFNFVIEKKVKYSTNFDVRLVSVIKKKEGTDQNSFTYNIYFGKFYRENNLNYSKVSIGTNGTGKDVQIIIVFDNNHFNNDNLEVKNGEVPRIASPASAIRKILKAMEVSEKDQQKGVEITWDAELVDAKQKVYRLRQRAFNILSTK